jgi:HAD superfamily hydrolase (TIGR01509 family)
MPLHYLAWKKAMATINISFPEDRFYAFAGSPTVTIIQTLAKEQSINCDPVATANLKERYYMESLESLEPIHSVMQIAQREKSRRKIAVASGGWKRVVIASLAVVGIDTLFDTIVGAEDVPHGKPAPDIFLKAAELLNVHPSKCIVYEDGELGIQAAHAAHMQCIDVRPWYLPRSRP